MNNKYPGSCCGRVLSRNLSQEAGIVSFIAFKYLDTWYVDLHLFSLAL